MVSVRFLIAGMLLFAWAQLRGVTTPESTHWKAAGLSGALLFMGGMGPAAWAMQFVPSGMAAVLLSLIPLWMVLLEWLWPPTSALGRRATRPGPRVMVGIVLIVGPHRLLQDGSEQGILLTLAGIGALTLSAFSWATGSLYLL